MLSYLTTVRIIERVRVHTCAPDDLEAICTLTGLIPSSQMLFDTIELANSIPPALKGRNVWLWHIQWQHISNEKLVVSSVHQIVPESGLASQIGQYEDSPESNRLYTYRAPIERRCQHSHRVTGHTDMNETHYEHRDAAT